MSQAEKLMHELSQNCGIDFNNTRKGLAKQIIEKYLAVPVMVEAQGLVPSLEPNYPIADFITSPQPAIFGTAAPDTSEPQESADVPTGK
jgi:hypothetical protein